VGLAGHLHNGFTQQPQRHFPALGHLGGDVLHQEVEEDESLLRRVALLQTVKQESLEEQIVLIHFFGEPEKQFNHFLLAYVVELAFGQNKVKH